MLFKQLWNCPCHAYQKHLVTRTRAKVEEDAKRPRSTSTTPKSSKGLQPDECDRLMGIGSVESSSGEDRDGDGELTESEIPTVEVTDDLSTKIDSCPSAVESSKCEFSRSPHWNRMPNQDSPAICPSQGLTESPKS